MIYQGSKARLRKYIIPILQKYIDDNNITTYIEPMCGGANVVDHIKCGLRIASDINPELIALLKYMQNNTLLSIFPDNCPFEHYVDVRENRKNKTGKYSVEYTAGIGYFASYAGRDWSGGYGRDKTGKRNIYAERLKYAREQAPLLRDIQFRLCDYSAYKNVKGALFYFDPPYFQTKTYGNQKFDYEKFYYFCKQISKHNFVFISEYDMPPDFKCIWEKERKVMQKSDRIKADVAVERLFTI